jgi:2,5-diketo-D-gluconate reductase B
MRSLNNIPQLGYGTWARTGDDGVAAIATALEIGYRHLDTAQPYGTEAPIARAIKMSGLKRSELFITTKVAEANLGRERFLPSVRESLDTLEMDAVDLLLIHWPSAGDAVPFEHYIEALGEARSLGLARLIGVSNFTIAMLDRADEILGRGAIATNQVEVHPFLQNRPLLIAKRLASPSPPICRLPRGRWPRTRRSWPSRRPTGAIRRRSLWPSSSPKG